MDCFVSHLWVLRSSLTSLIISKARYSSQTYFTLGHFVTGRFWYKLFHCFLFIYFNGVFKISSTMQTLLQPSICFAVTLLSCFMRSFAVHRGCSPPLPLHQWGYLQFRLRSQKVSAKGYQLRLWQCECQCPRRLCIMSSFLCSLHTGAVASQLYPYGLKSRLFPHKVVVFFIYSMTKFMTGIGVSFYWMKTSPCWMWTSLACCTLGPVRSGRILVR